MADQAESPKVTIPVAEFVELQLTTTALAKEGMDQRREMRGMSDYIRQLEQMLREVQTQLGRQESVPPEGEEGRVPISPEEGEGESPAIPAQGRKVRTRS